MGIVEDLVGHILGQDIQVPVALWEVLVATADCRGYWHRTVALSFSPLGPWKQVARRRKIVNKSATK